ncbi:MAG: hypothetical protein RM022_003980 [Nostoc sp. EfeVER01]|nr:hypothetical protein [Nostoc sp. EfeVER01]MDZ7943945.1 hypothetical protein [Nostoc sp. EfeVER01]
MRFSNARMDVCLNDLRVGVARRRHRSFTYFTQSDRRLKIINIFS